MQNKKVYLRYECWSSVTSNSFVFKSDHLFVSQLKKEKTGLGSEKKEVRMRDEKNMHGTNKKNENHTTILSYETFFTSQKNTMVCTCDQQQRSVVIFVCVLERISLWGHVFFVSAMYVCSHADLSTSFFLSPLPKKNGP